MPFLSTVFDHVGHSHSVRIAIFINRTQRHRPGFGQVGVLFLWGELDLTLSVHRFPLLLCKPAAINDQFRPVVNAASSEHKYSDP